MGLLPELIEILRCPKCVGLLELRADGSAFICHACALVYAVQDDIPNFLVEEATQLQPSASPGSSAGA